MRRLTYYVAASVDGFIAGPHGEVDAFVFEGELAGWILDQHPETIPVQARGPLGVADRPNRHFDTVLMGRSTYEPALALGIASPYPHLRQVVFSTTLAAPTDGVEVVAGDPVAAVRELKQQPGAGIWLAGGGRLAGALLEEVDELVVKRNPVLLGAGTPMVDAPFGAHRFDLAGARSLDPGVVVETYRRRVG